MAAGLLIIPQFMPARNLAGASVAAEMVFYLADTNDLEPVYTDNTLAVAHPSPLQSDASGYFPVIWANTSKVFDVGFAKDNGEPPLTVTGVSPGTSLTAASAQQASDAATAANVAKEAAEDAQAATQALYGDAQALDDAVEAAETARDQAVQAAQASGGALNIPWSDKSAAYTVLVADAGKAFDLTGTFTLTLSAAATLAADFTFAVRNSGTGVWTIDPNGAELIDSLSTIKVYPGESFVVGCTGSAFRTIGRAKRVQITRTVVSSAVATVDFTTGLNDSEFDSFELDLDGLSHNHGSAANFTVQLDVGSGYASPTRAAKATGILAIASTATGVFSNESDSGAQAAAAVHMSRMRFSRGAMLQAYTTVDDGTNAAVRQVDLWCLCPANTVGVRIAPTAGSIDSLKARLYGNRAA